MFKNRNFLPLLFPLLLFLINGSVSVDRAPRFGGAPLPDTIRKIMEEKYPGWHPVDNLCLLDSKVVDLDTTVAFPNHVWGDFNKDGTGDHALFARRKAREDREQQLILGFVSGPNGYSVHELCKQTEPAYCGNMIWLLGKGDRFYSFQKGKRINAPSDGVSSIVLEKGQVTYFYETGKFKRIVTGD